MGMELPARRLRPRHQDLPIHRYHASKNKTCTHRPPHRLGSYWRKIPITLIIAGVEGFWLRPFTIVIPNEVRNPHFADGLLFSVRLRCQFKAYTLSNLPEEPATFSRPTPHSGISSKPRSATSSAPITSMKSVLRFSKARNSSPAASAKKPT